MDKNIIDLAELLKDMATAQVEGDKDIISLVNSIIERHIELEATVIGLMRTVTIHSELLRLMIKDKNVAVGTDKKDVH